MVIYNQYKYDVLYMPTPLLAAFNQLHTEICPVVIKHTGTYKISMVGAKKGTVKIREMNVKEPHFDVNEP